jgi:hypothetical protein
MTQEKPKFIISTSQIVINRKNQVPVFVPKTDKRFGKIVELLKAEDWEGLEGALTGSLKNKILAYAEGKVRVDENDDVFIGEDKEAIPKVIGRKIVEFYKEGLPIDPIVRFWIKLRKNPSNRSQTQLFGFLEANKIPISNGGNFIAYKKVSVKEGKLVDTRTLTLDNSVGTTVKMNRADVDDDPNQTCSRGLHVAGWDYAQGFSGQVLVEVEVNPENVVAVPVDYNNQKMRVCEYTVVNVCEAQIDEILRNSKTESDNRKAIEAATEKAAKDAETQVANFANMSPVEIADFIKNTTGRDINAEALQAELRKKNIRV